MLKAEGYEKLKWESAGPKKTNSASKTDEDVANSFTTPWKVPLSTFLISMLQLLNMLLLWRECVRNDVLGPTSILKSRVDQDQSAVGRHIVSYMPVEVGLHRITVKWHNTPVDGKYWYCRWWIWLSLSTCHDTCTVYLYSIVCVNTLECLALYLCTKGMKTWRCHFICVDWCAHRPYEVKVIDPRKINVAGGWATMLDASRRIHLTAHELKRLDFITRDAGPGWYCVTGVDVC